jgi:hypothetical protein
MSLVLLACAPTLGCGKAIPKDLEATVTNSLPVAIQVAEAAAKICPSQAANAPTNGTPPANTPPPPSPAIGTALETDPHIADVFVMCSFQSTKDPALMGGTSLRSLHGTSQMPTRNVTLPEDMAKSTCDKTPKSCEQVIVPSRVLASEKSADIRVIRPFPGGEVEVRVVLQAK